MPGDYVPVRNAVRRREFEEQLELIGPVPITKHFCRMIPPQHTNQLVRVVSY